MDSGQDRGVCHAEDKASDGAHISQDIRLSPRRLTIVFAADLEGSAFNLAFFLVALDQTILSTALPTIASHFKAVSDLSWIASAYFLPQAGLVLFFGRLLVITPAKRLFLVSIFTFEIGSLLCALAPSVNVLIVGRAVAGLGGTGLWVSIMSIIARITTMKQRPIFMGLIGAVFALASVVGPLIGGAFSDHVSWRFVYILRIGFIAIIAVILALPHLPTVKTSGSAFKMWLHLDWVGAVLSFAMVTVLLLAVQWGGNEKPWNDPTVIALLVLFAVFLIAFIGWETWYGPEAILPVSIVCRRNIFGAGVATPLLYQVRGHSATRSGIDILPFMTSLMSILVSFVAGAVTSTTGYAWPFLVLFPLIASAAFGLLFTVTANTSSATIIGFQVLVGVGLGSCIQLPIVVAQGEFVGKDQHLIPQTTSLVTFLQLLGSSTGLAIAGAVFQGQLRSRLSTLDLPPALFEEVLSSVKAIFAIPQPEQSQVVGAYVAAVERVFLIGIPCGIIATLGALLIERRKVQMEVITPST
ncbi:ABC transporter [Mycena pura]|uniref:ABC transporter n=1 Tax=Mycena pura TaxID=153505 RepID=A0AAD6YBZ2_9AGAR|nr:ABC transporter [Mycena pura]